MKESMFNTHLNWAISLMEGYCCEENLFANDFFRIYPFTTENICGYINSFNLENKSLLTLGSSLDQVINAILMGCIDLSVYDICPFTKYYFYLKKAGIMTLSYPEFLNYFCYVDYPKTFKYNQKVFGLDTYFKLVDTLKLLDYESFLFWDELFCNYAPLDVRMQLFHRDEYNFKILQQVNLYMKNEEWFIYTKEMIRNITPIFIYGDIYQLENLGIYDNIFLSNLACYNQNMNSYKEFIDHLCQYLSDDGMMLFAYLYETVRNTKYHENWQVIYDLDNTCSLFQEYLSEFNSFRGVKGIRFSNDNMKDSVLIYKKGRRV